MHIIKRAKLVEFWNKKENIGSEGVLDIWYRVLKKALYQNIAQLRADFPHADIVGECVIFNVGGHKYRVVTKIFFREQTVLIRFVLTHKEYDKKPFAEDCLC